MVGPQASDTFAPYDMPRPAMRAWHRRQLRRLHAMPVPAGEPVIRAAAPGGDNVLLLGSGQAKGFGVTQQEDSLIGHLAAGIEVTTSRPCSVAYVGGEAMTIAAAPSWVTGHDVTAYDAVVVIIGLSDVVRLGPATELEKDVRTLTNDIARRARWGLRIVLVGLPPVKTLIRNRVVAFLAEQAARRLNATIESVAGADEAISYLRLPSSGMSPDDPGAAYRAWGQLIAEHLAPQLDEVRREEGRARKDRTLIPRSFTWSTAGSLLDRAHEKDVGRLQDLVDAARSHFRVTAAAVTLFGPHQLHFAVSTGPLPSCLPRSLTLCDVTVRLDQPVIVPDVRKAERFKTIPQLQPAWARFYAAHPLHAADDQVIGTLALFHTRPKKSTPALADDLTRLALRVERELHSYDLPREAP